MKKILFLTMSCNNAYYRALLGAVKDTWAKPFMQNKYKDQIEWFAYTSCDKKHPNPCIDYEDHMIYVDCPDDMVHTYMKTQLAYQMIVDTGIKFDYIVRTNTSVYVNIDKLLKRIIEVGDDKIIGDKFGYYYKYDDGRIEFQFNCLGGLFMCMNKEKFEIALSATNDYWEIPTGDDIIMSRKLIEYFGSLDVINPNSGSQSRIYRYKSYLPNDEKEINKTGYKCLFIDDPSFVNESIVIQVRPLYGDLKERAEKGHEFEHIYELYEAKNQ